VTRFGLDSTGEVPSWAHHAAGSTVALRYLSRSTAKVITRSEHERYKAAGIDLVLVFEDSATNSLGGYGQGKADAEFALSQAHGILGVPVLPAAIRFAVDFDTVGSPERTDAYFDGAAAVMHRSSCGPYGSFEIVRHAAGRGFQRLWQTYAWSAGRFFSSPLNTVYQYSNDHTIGGVGVDFNHLFGADFGQYDRKPAAPSDPHGYWRFAVGPFSSPRGPLSERSVVLHYDGARKHLLRWPGLLRQLEAQCRFLADRIAHEVISEAQRTGRPRNWVQWDRGWRYQQLIRRAQGLKLA
jgi:hypothetical protein